MELANAIASFDQSGEATGAVEPGWNGMPILILDRRKVVRLFLKRSSHMTVSSFVAEDLIKVKEHWAGPADLPTYPWAQQTPNIQGSRENDGASSVASATLIGWLIGPARMHK